MDVLTTADGTMEQVLRWSIFHDDSNGVLVDTMCTAEGMVMVKTLMSSDEYERMLKGGSTRKWANRLARNSYLREKLAEVLRTRCNVEITFH